jgi:phage gp36-like protein
MYLSIEDLKKGMRSEVLNVVARSDENIEQAIIDAMAEVESYLSARYNIALEFQKEPNDTTRVPMVVKVVRDIAIYNAYSISAPINMPEAKVKTYDDTIRFLRDVQAEKANIIGLKRNNVKEDGTADSNYISFSSASPKRTHHY